MQNTISFLAFSKAVFNALSPQKRNTFESFFTTPYKTKFKLSKLGKVEIETKEIGTEIMLQILKVTPTENVCLNMGTLPSMVGFSFYLEEPSSFTAKIPLLVNTSIVRSNNNRPIVIPLKKNKPLVIVNIYIPNQDFIALMGDALSSLPIQFQKALKNEQPYYVINKSANLRINQQLIDLCKNDFPVASAVFLRKSAVMEIIGLELKETIDNENEGSSLAAETEKLDLACLIMKNSLENPPKIKKLAQQVGLSEFKLKDGFKKKFQMPVYQFLIHCRMKKAAELLLKDSYSVKEIAYTVGYSNPNAFSNAFYKNYGMYPTQYLKKKWCYSVHHTEI